MHDKFDVIVIGSGPGGYAAAIRAAQLGFKTAIVEKYETLGGTCTNVGCIPSKALLDSTEHYHMAQNKFSMHGIEVHDLKLNFQKLMDRKDNVVKQNTSGLNYLMKKNRIEIITGIASFVNTTSITVQGNSGYQGPIKGKYFIIATGSKPAILPGIAFDSQRIISSTEALAINELPASMAIIGGGVIGVEMASIFARIGTKVTIIEYADRLIPSMDKELSSELKKVLTKLKIEFIFSAKVQEIENEGSQTLITYADSYGNVKPLNADYSLISVGRTPFTKDLNLETIGINVDNKGRIVTNDHLETSVKNIYAIGDVIQGPMLAHKAEEDGVYVAEIIHGQSPKLNYHLIPSVVYTWPEIASVGFTEEELRKNGKTYRVGKFPFFASGRARAAMEPDGFVKVLADSKYGEVLGVHIIGPRAADLIAQAVTGIHYEATDEDMFRISYAHPTYSEALKEAFLQASGQGSLNL